MYLEGQRIRPGTGHAAGRRLLEAMFLRYAGSPLPEIQTTGRGKPYFAHSPWHFSISHTKNHVFCVLSRKNVGIDAEELERKANPKLAEKILSPGEKAQYEAAEDKNRALLTLWVLKEAFVKLTGQGLRGYPNQTEFSLEDPRVQIIDGCLVAVMEEEDHVI